LSEQGFESLQEQKFFIATTTRPSLGYASPT